jgi:hypothetical protein
LEEIAALFGDEVIVTDTSKALEKEGPVVVEQKESASRNV